MRSSGSSSRCSTCPRNADQMGVSFAWFNPRALDDSSYVFYEVYQPKGRSRRGRPTRSRCANLDLSAQSRFVRAFTVPQISWEPVFNLTTPGDRRRPAVRAQPVPQRRRPDAALQRQRRARADRADPRDRVPGRGLRAADERLHRRRCSRCRSACARSPSSADRPVRPAARAQRSWRSTGPSTTAGCAAAFSCASTRRRTRPRARSSRAARCSSTTCCVPTARRPAPGRSAAASARSSTSEFFFDATTGYKRPRRPAHAHRLLAATARASSATGRTRTQRSPRPARRSSTSSSAAPRTR